MITKKEPLQKAQQLFSESRTKNVIPFKIFFMYGGRSKALLLTDKLMFYQYATPCHFIASATFMKPAIFAPATRLPSMPYSLAAL